MKQILVALSVLSVLLIAIQPPLPIKGGAECPRLPFKLCPRIWDARHIPSHAEDDLSIWETGQLDRAHYPAWLLMAAAVCGLCGLVAAVGNQRDGTTAGKRRPVNVV